MKKIKTKRRKKDNIVWPPPSQQQFPPIIDLEYPEEDFFDYEPPPFRKNLNVTVEQNTPQRQSGTISGVKLKKNLKV
jgi:hypothetical protein